MSGPTEGTLRLFARACIADARVWRGAAFYAEVTDRTATEVDLLDERADHLEPVGPRRLSNLVKAYGPFQEQATAELVAKRAIEKYVGHRVVITPRKVKS